ncbi:MAG: ComF family protein, partial [Clostridia bacterium]
GTELEICDSCYERIPFIQGKACSQCGQPIEGSYGSEQCLDCRDTLHYFVKNIPVCEYKGLVRQAIVRFKFFGKRRYAKPLGFLMADQIKQMTNVTKFDIITYIPLSKRRLAQRGFNQSRLLCRSIAKRLKLFMGIDMLNKEKDMPPQSTLNRHQRQRNIKNVFRVTDKYNIKDTTILLVDDVYTTGVTVNECSRLLRDAGVKEVYVVTIAIGKGIC